MVIDEDLTFDHVRSGSDQWVVKHGDLEVARVTHRIIASPPYLVTRIVGGRDAAEVKVETREAVVDTILAWVNTPQS